MSFPSDERPSSQDWKPKQLPHKLRIAFIHPDLGIGRLKLPQFGFNPRLTSSVLCSGGAERLVVDAAVGLQQLGHSVEIFTSYHQDGPDGRSFTETRDGKHSAPAPAATTTLPANTATVPFAGTLKVHVLGNSFFPPSIKGKLTIVCSILRQLHLSLSFLLAVLLFHLATWVPFFGRLLIPLATAFSSSADWSPLRQLQPFDVIIIDQLSASIPLLRLAGLNRIVFYCHFPDLLLAPDRSASLEAHRANRSLLGRLRALYRLPLDKLEETTTGCADKIVVNSDFTSGVFARTFAGLGRVPRVVYPAVDVYAYDKEEGAKEEDKWLVK